METPITPEIISAAAGILISLFLTYIPKLNMKWQALEADYKRLILLAALLIVSLGAYGLSCLAVVSWLSCTQAGLWLLIKIFVSALIANQATYPITPGVDKIKAKARALRANG